MTPLDTRRLRLPDRFAEVDAADWPDLAAWEHVAVEDARRDGRVADPATMLVWSRSAGSSLDDIADRVAASTPRDRTGGLLGRITTAGHHDRARRSRRSPALEAVRVEQDLLAHRPIDLGPLDGRLAYHATASELVLAEEGSPVTWRFPFTYLPPAVVATGVADDDVPEPWAWRILPLDGVCWLPFDRMLRDGRWQRWQDLRGRLVDQVPVGCLPLFVSHRWTDRHHPDPDGRQAQLLAWQLAAAVVEAVHIAAARGVDVPRRRVVGFGCRAGPGGSDLVEAIVVAVLRPTLDDAAVAAMLDEVSGLAELDLPGPDLLAVAEADVDLRRLAALLEARPRLAALCGRLHLWIDYCCLPQPPRSTAETEVFRAGLERLGAVQLLGRTVIPLDDVDAYSRRAWCLLEVVTADRLSGTVDVLAAATDTADPAGGAAAYLSELLLDLPHLLWRALLDVEVLGLGAQLDVFERCGLEVTDPNDLPYLYDRLRGVPGPNRLHTLLGDLVTGIVPMPTMLPGIAVVPTRSERPAVVPVRQRVGNLPWHDACDLSARAAPTPEVADLATAPLIHFDPAGDGRPLAHVAVIAACEGEAVLLAERVDSCLGELEQLVGVDVVSRSWVADDVAPVGGLVFGAVAAVGIAAPTWVLVTTSARRDHCAVTNLLATSARRAGRGLVWVLADTGAVEVEADGPRIAPTRPDDDVAGDLAPVPDGGWGRLGGVYRADLVDFLREVSHG